MGLRVCDYRPSSMHSGFLSNVDMDPSNFISFADLAEICYLFYGLRLCKLS